MSRRSRGSQSSGYPSSQSAQPYKSVFGGQSQNEGIDLSTLPDPIAAAEESDVGDAYDYESLPPMPDDSDDDPDYDDRSVARSSRASRSARKSKTPAREKGKNPVREPSANIQRSKSSDARSRNRRRSSAQASASESREKDNDKLSDEELFEDELQADNVIADVARTSASPPPYRPNRFTGAPSTWRKYTESERRIAQSLEDMRARDLFVHLFNAFALKQRARMLRQEYPEGTDYWDTVSGVRVPTKPFEPNSRWTAWPMPANEVPRTEYEAAPTDDEEWTFKREPDPRPSSDLEEAITAVMMRIAKEKILERQWKLRKRHRKHQKSRNESTEPDLTDHGNDRPRPLVQADDDLARRQLLPEVRNIVTSLERVLDGLHEDRYTFGTSAVPSRRTSGIRSGGSHGTSSNQRRARPASQKAPRARKLTNAKWANVIKAPRRWHDVLGVALMSGISESVVERAAGRCAELFGGSTEIFQSLREGRVKRVIEEDEDGMETATWEFVQGETPSESGAEEEDADHPLAWLLPEVQDEAESESEKTVSKKFGSKNSPPPESSLLPSSAATAPAPEPTPPRPPGKRRKKTREELVCPFPDCPRHQAGFSRTWNLNLHLKRVHSDYEKPT